MTNNPHYLGSKTRAKNFALSGVYIVKNRLSVFVKGKSRICVGIMGYIIVYWDYNKDIRGTHSTDMVSITGTFHNIYSVILHSWVFLLTVKTHFVLASN